LAGATDGMHARRDGLSLAHGRHSSLVPDAPPLAFRHHILPVVWRWPPTWPCHPVVALELCLSDEVDFEVI
jgi:hypothetical protein